MIAIPVDYLAEYPIDPATGRPTMAVPFNFGEINIVSNDRLVETMESILEVHGADCQCKDCQEPISTLIDGLTDFDDDDEEYDWEEGEGDEAYDGEPEPDEDD